MSRSLKDRFLEDLATTQKSTKKILNDLGVSYRGYLVAMNRDEDFRALLEEARRMRAMQMHDDFTNERVKAVAGEDVLALDEEAAREFKVKVDALQKVQAMVDKAVVRDDPQRFGNDKDSNTAVNISLTANVEKETVDKVNEIFAGRLDNDGNIITVSPKDIKNVVSDLDKGDGQRLDDAR